MARRGADRASASADLSRQLLGCSALLQAEHVVVGYSGGLDSTVLLHLLAALRQHGRFSCRLSALHVHHGLQASADRWLVHCREQAAALAVELIEHRVEVSQQAGQSPEAAARDARYLAFAAVMQPGTVLALAHHADDQMETMILHLLRGSGPRGLAGMPQQRPLGSGILCRPLLQVERAALRLHAEQAGLRWVEDPSNGDLRFTRNRLRHTVLPALQAMAPAVAHSVARSAGLCGEAAQLLQELAVADLAPARCPQANQLLLSALTGMQPARLRNALRHWVLELVDLLDGCSITHEALQHCITQLLPARPDAEPVIAWGAGTQRLELRRYAGRLYLVKPLPSLPGCLTWSDPGQPLVLPGMLGSLQCELAGEPAGTANLSPLEVRFRQGGECVERPGRGGLSLKRLLHDAGVPPWLRPGVPIVFCADRLLAVGDIYSTAGALPQMSGKTLRFRWLRQQLHCGY